MASYTDIAQALEQLLTMYRGRGAPENVFLTRCDVIITEAKKRNLEPVQWTPFVKAARTGELPPEHIIHYAMGILKRSYEETVEAIRRMHDNWELATNSRYQVMMRAVGPDLVWLSVRRLDRAPIRSWRDLQRIKTELMGPECEAVEIFPPEEFLVDQANQYHLWCCTTPGKQFPFGFVDGRNVIGTDVYQSQNPLDQM